MDLFNALRSRPREVVGPAQTSVSAGTPTDSASNPFKISNSVEKREVPERVRRLSEQLKNRGM